MPKELSYAFRLGSVCATNEHPQQTQENKQVNFSANKNPKVMV
jgi:hypothetical protein